MTELDLDEVFSVTLTDDFLLRHFVTEVERSLALLVSRMSMFLYLRGETMWHCRRARTMKSRMGSYTSCRFTLEQASPGSLHR